MPLGSLLIDLDRPPGSHVIRRLATHRPDEAPCCPIGGALLPALARACFSNSPQRASSASEVPNCTVGRTASGANRAARPAVAPARAATSAAGRIAGSLKVPPIWMRVGSEPTVKLLE